LRFSLMARAFPAEERTAHHLPPRAQSTRIKKSDKALLTAIDRVKDDRSTPWLSAA
jgi:hypothetical protein